MEFFLLIMIVQKDLSESKWDLFIPEIWMKSQSWNCNEIPAALTSNMFNEQFKKLPKKTKHLRSLRHFYILSSDMEQLVIKWLHSFHFHLSTLTFSRLGKITNWLGTAQSLEEWTPLWSTPGICGFQIFCSITGALRKWFYWYLIFIPYSYKNWDQ